MKKTWKKVIALSMTAMMVVPMIVGCTNNTGTGAVETTISAGDSTGTTGENKSEVEKPEKITVMVNTRIFTIPNARAAFEEKWEEMTGIDMVITQPDHDAYYDVLGQTFAGGIDDWPDVVLLDSTYYTGYAGEGALWDMTEAWENSELKASGRIVDDALVEGMYLDGRLYAFAPARGNGCITYIKKKWLDNVGLDVPTNYEEYKAMLKAFSEEDPDGNGINGDTYGVSSAGLIATEAPWTNFLPEIFQDAYPTFYQKEDGTWVDGFTEPAMDEALLRLREVYDNGWLDKESLTNGTRDVRNKFYEDKFGVFTYWSGTWATNNKLNLENNGLDGELIAIPPIAEVDAYWERVAYPAWGITVAAKNPEGIFKYFIENMLDGGDMQILWTYGVEDVHWSTKAETVCGNEYQEGEFHFKESLEVPGTQYTKHHIEPMLSIARFNGEDPGAIAVAPEAAKSQEVFTANAKFIPLPASTEEMADLNGDLFTLKRSIVADMVVEGLSIEGAKERFEKEGGAKWSQTIVDSLNAK
jgi:ABC-type sugar transport system, periplasmic component